mmetsp:Transcript_79749/g.215622  ORF Transcript_79749/g.215622 Transcript_79749/m.215622 type:complete len:762 (-) Transcript_79749:29-2314(-)
MGNRVFCSGNMCPKATLQPAGDNELFDDTSACDPAGTVFNETLEDLNEVDRLLLVFSSSSNLAAIRWLFALGANLDACDTSGTTCLHAACRSGSLPIVREFIRRELPLDTTDVAGWTALHVALFMGRRTVAMELMRSGADLVQRNSRGLAPSDLCSDVWLREAIHSCAAHRHTYGLQRAWEFGRESELGEDVQISSKLRFEPFFVPRSAIVKDLPKSGHLQHIGVEIFNQRPGQGLAFLVSTGAVRDFPVELSGFLSEHTVSLTQVGEFLGEDFSLSQTLRLEYINSVRLMGTGVVSCLAKVFKQFHIPTDMQKIDRLIDGIAQIWWRQHEQIRLKDTEPAEPLGNISSQETGEVEGLRLMRQLKNYDTLHRLMFAAVMLHWNLYAPLPPSQRVTPERWMEMNADIEQSCRADPAARAAMRHIQSLIYNMVSRTFYPQLQIWSSRPPRSLPSSTPLGAGSPGRVGSGGGGGFSAGDGVPVVAGGEPGGEPGGVGGGGAEGWALLVGGGFPSFAGSSGTITYRHIRSILSETTSTAFTLASPNVSRQDPEAMALGDSAIHSHAPRGAAFRHSSGRLPCAARSDLHPSPLGTHGPPDLVGKGSRQDWVWLSVREGLLFLAPKPTNWAPYAFVHLRGVAVQAMDTSTCTITLGADSSAPKAGAEDPRTRQVGLRCNGGLPHDAKVHGEPEGPSLMLVFLLPDGRWQVLELPRLRVQVPDLKQLELWRQTLAAHCTFADSGEAPRESAKRAALPAEAVFAGLTDV